MICTPKKVNGNEGAINGVTPRTKQNDVKEPLINNRSSDNSNVGDKHPVEVSYSTASSTLWGYRWSATHEARNVTMMLWVYIVFVFVSECQEWIILDKINYKGNLSSVCDDTI